MKIYLDTCSLQRPLDSKSQIRISLEAEAVLGILTLCESDQVELLSSDALVFEAQRNPITVRREYALEVLSRAHSFITLNKWVESRAEEFNKLGMEPLDALHLALAEKAEADYFCTCDDQFLKRAKAVKNLKTKVVTPIELIEEIENDS
jgi:predicted nucleic acid-binding protein